MAFLKQFFEHVAGKFIYVPFLGGADAGGTYRIHWVKQLSTSQQIQLTGNNKFPALLQVNEGECLWVSQPPKIWMGLIIAAETRRISVSVSILWRCPRGQIRLYLLKNMFTNHQRTSHASLNYFLPHIHQSLHFVEQESLCLLLGDQGW